MTVQMIIIVAEVAVIIPLVALMILRQVRGQYMDRRRLWGTPIIMAAVALVYLPFTVSAVVPVDGLLVGVELIFSVGVGLLLGMITTTRVVAVPDHRGRHVQIVSGWRGGALWLAFIGVRLAVQPLAASLDANLTASAGVILILIAVARTTMAVIVSPRVDAATASTAHVRLRDHTNR